MNRKTLIILVCLLLIIAVGFNLYQYTEINKLSNQISKIDTEFKTEILRTASLIRQNDIKLAFENAVRLDTLSKFTSYYKDKTGFLNYPAIIVTDIRNHITLSNEIKNKKEISDLLNELSKNPTDQVISDRILMLLQQD
ncbi:hypothetical protein EJP77_10420 [Paenibacillus zeisoli]|uniref:DUF4363 family protein n=1 Tax=Paenibacillus zeisoli TaxID=2496267 RepID=A0A433XCI8_9BACL|nr:hypothetical protein [Paenibacillus zeisoli]RUT31792.1 hypothetical protein EJP77_10420 [Paenibacillus zeisoli]